MPTALEHLANGGCAPEGISYLRALSEEQWRAVRAECPVLVMAGSGSGKTRCLISRIAHLILHEGVPAERILAITYTRKATAEMRDRIHRLLTAAGGHEMVSMPTVQTIHAFCRRIVLADVHEYFTAYNKPLEVVTGYKQRRLMEDSLKQVGYNQYDRQWQPAYYLRLISYLVSMGFSVDQGLDNAREHTYLHIDINLQGIIEEHSDEFMEIWEIYQSRKLKGTKDCQYIDFSDMLWLAFCLLTRHATVCDRWANSFDHVLVDEFQDVDPIQSRIIKSLVEEHRQLWATGDVRQSIYGFRAAAPSISLQFADYIGGNTLYLMTNYRSGRDIVAAGNKIISSSHDLQHLPAMQGHQTDNGVVNYRGHYTDPFREAQAVVAKINGHYSDHAVLYRTNAQSEALEAALVKRDIPYEIVGGTRFYERASIRDMLCYLFLAYDFDGAASAAERDMMIKLSGLLTIRSNYPAMERIYGRPRRYLGHAWLGKWMDYVDAGCGPMQALQKPYYRPYMDRGAGELYAVLESAAFKLRNDQPLVRVFRGLVDDLNYEEWYLAQYGEDADSKLADDFGALTKRLWQFQTVGELVQFAGRTLQADPFNKATNPDDVVQLMTIHKAKGKEFPTVHLVGVGQGLLPHRYSLEQGETEEERRIFYVAMTRAKHRIFVTSLGREPSEFLHAVFPRKELAQQAMLSEADNGA